MAYTTTDLLNSIRQRGSIPTTTNSSNVNNTTNLLAMATEELHIKLLPMILSAREEYYVTYKDYSITANQATYTIPTRASGQVLRDVQLISGTTVKSLPLIDSERITSTATGSPSAYYLEHNKVVLYPTPSTTVDTLRLRYYLRPSRLAATSACVQITAIDTATFTVTVAAVPSTMTANAYIDYVAADAPFQNRAIDQLISSVTSTTIIMTGLPSDLAVGDWVALADYTPIPQIPFEFIPVLSQMTVVKSLEALGDREGAKNAAADLQIIQNNALALIAPRNHGEPKKVVPRRWR